MIVLEAVDLAKDYRGGDGGTITVLDGVDLQVARGEMVAVVGASGAGKSTLLHLLGALDVPTRGAVTIAGQPLANRTDDDLSALRNRSVGFVFQFHHLLPEFSALENAMMPALIGGMKRHEAEALATGLLRDVGLAHRLTHRPGELSGGEQQRVAIARALVLSPKLLLADEPTGNLDMKTSDEVHDLLAYIHREKGVTLVIVTHNERLAAGMGRTIRMVDGRIE
jgi:lipoprotein-releasing system ATP-binding protein